MWRDSDDDDANFTIRDDRGSSTESIAYLMPVAWSSLRRPYHPPWRATLVVDSTATQSFGVTADLCNAVANDFRRQRGAALARGIARAGIKLALAKAAEKKAEDKHGEFAGSLTRFVLPGELSIVRVILPAGTHDLSIDYVARPGDAPRRLVIGPTVVTAGRIAFATTRIWDDGVTQRQPLAFSH
jgi:hypothetical protein